MKTIDDIEQDLFLSKSKIKNIIKNLGIDPIKKDKYNKFYYTDEQVTLIKENNP